MTRGNDIFYFGNSTNPIEFNKQEIASIRILNLSNDNKAPTGFILTEISFKDGTHIHIPNIFLSNIALLSKLYNYPYKYKPAIPFIKNAEKTL